MRVALIYLGRRGGGATYSLEVAKALAQKAEILTVISRQAWNLDAWRETNLRLVMIPTYHSVWGLVPSTLNLRKHIALRKQIQRFDPDVLYYPMLHLWTPLINWLLPAVPKIATIHDPVLHQGERSPVIGMLQRSAVSQATRIVILSQAFVKTMERQGVPRERIDVIPHGEFSYYSGGSNSLNSERHPPTLLFFGRISKYKGLEVLLSAFPLVKKQVPEARLLVVGNGDLGPYEKQLTELRDVDVVNRWVKDDEVAAYFRQADLLVVPYTDASQSGVIPIAYTFRVPVVATRVGGIPEQVEDGKTGLLVTSGNASQLAEASVRLLTDSAWAAKLGQAGYEKAMQEWSWEHVSDQVLASLGKASGMPYEGPINR
ncbi:glycosyltransferase family 4 protein [Candidatus Bipolaricaulota bacterium]